MKMMHSLITTQTCLGFISQPNRDILMPYEGHVIDIHTTDLDRRDFLMIKNGKLIAYHRVDDADLCISGAVCDFDHMATHSSLTIEGSASLATALLKYLKTTHIQLPKPMVSPFPSPFDHLANDLFQSIMRGQYRQISFIRNSAQGDR